MNFNCLMLCHKVKQTCYSLLVCAYPNMYSINFFGENGQRLFAPNHQ